MPSRIRDRASAVALTRPRTSSAGAARLTSQAPPFGEHLALAGDSLVRQDLDRLYTDVEDQGRRLLESPTPEQLARYKQYVRDFVAYVVKNGLKLRSSLSSRELHQIVDRVDEDLLALADTFLSRERPIMDLAAKIDHINGVLFDLKA
jgi:uncharacterized protein YaaR (DUF327 family)